MIHITSLSGMHGEAIMAPVQPAHGAQPTRRPPTVLVVEDDPASRLALACMVADSTRQVVMAASAEQALAHLPLVDPDLILCDFVLGGMNGRQFCVALRSDPRWFRTPLIMVTCMDAPSILADLRASGADEVLTKPVGCPHLRARVEASLADAWRIHGQGGAPRLHGRA